MSTSRLTTNLNDAETTWYTGRRYVGVRRLDYHTGFIEYEMCRESALDIVVGAVPDMLRFGGRGSNALLRSH